MSALKYAGWRDPNLHASVLRHLDRAGHEGLTVSELRLRYDPDTEAHHGWVSAALSILHKDNKIARLGEKRAGCRVYVERDFLDDRKPEAYGGSMLTKDERERLTEIRDFMDYWFTVDNEGARFATDRTRAERNHRLFFAAARPIFGDSVNT